jgi:type I restriction enzyme M protein
VGFTGRLPNPKDRKVEALEARIGEQEKAVREAQANADAIDAAVFDLKAVNPNAVVQSDTRTPEQIVTSIEQQGAIVADALRSLRSMLHGQTA